MTPRLGDFAVVATGGWQARVIRWVTRRPVNHAFVYVGNGLIVEAEPKGAKLSPVTKYPDAIWAQWPLTEAQRLGIAAWALRHVGTPYSWLDDAYIGFVKLFGWAPKFMRKRLASTATLQCAQLVDADYDENGEHLFPDGRPCGGVSPGDLWDLIQARRFARSVITRR